MKVWAEDTVKAKSKFWYAVDFLDYHFSLLFTTLDCNLRYFLRKLRRVKKANGQILSINEVSVD
jgi:large subunit ribosomal protein L18Ae